MTPVVIQSESAECGLACLAMVAGTYGRRIDIATLRDHFPVSARGTSLKAIIEFAAQLQLHARAYRCDLDALRELQMPCILHWNMNHYIVLVRASERGMTIHDPLCGRRQVSWREASEAFTGIALCLEPMVGFSRGDERRRMRLDTLFSGVAPLRQSLMLVFACSLVLQCLQVALPLLLKITVDELVALPSSHLLLTVAAIFAALQVMIFLVTLARSWVVTYVSAKLANRWTGDVVAHLFGLPLTFFEKRGVSDVMSRLGGIAVIQRTLSTGFVETMIDGLTAIVVLSLMFAYNWSLALVSLSALVIYMALRAIGYGRQRDLINGHIVAQSKQQGHLIESLRAMLSLKANAHEEIRAVQWSALQGESANEEMRVARFRASTVACSQLVFGLERIVTITLATTFVWQQAMTVGLLVAFLAYRDMLSLRLGSLVDRFFEFRMLRVYADRLGEIVMAEPEPRHFVAHEMSEQPASIEVNGVDFTFGPADPHVLRGVTFAVTPGESVAIVGPSGCGKSTLLKLMLGLLTPSTGSIRIDGRLVQEFDPRRLRAMVGAVMQDDHLLSGTIAQNIAMFDPAATSHEVEKAAQAAGAIGFVKALPLGFDTLVGELGSSLSGGQKQRIILARALYRKPRMLLLDEATSHLDSRSEAEVNTSIARLRITRIIVAHRPETIRSADRVVELAGAADISVSRRKLTAMITAEGQ
ncbi:MAG: peptidase domain-containing ABC transporter [Xanthomonadales bacterium]|nr:peptidase domain-containing ABC transporter [Xanthomonadales bacterium]